MTNPTEAHPVNIVAFGEVLLRLAAPTPQLLFQNMSLLPSYCGAEFNASVALTGFGHRCRMVTALPDNPVGAAARRTIASFGVELSARAIPTSRMGLYFLETGAMARPSKITYDRTGSAFATSAASDYDWGTLLDGADWLFASGITAALGDAPLAALREAIAAAGSVGVRVAFDTNFRPSLWTGREREAGAILRELSCEADLLFAGRRATALMAGGAYDHPDPSEGFHAAAQTMFEIAPRLRHMAATRREIWSSDSQTLTGLLADREGLSVSETLSLERIVDRVGTGDAFAAGVLHGLSQDMSRDDTISFGVTCAQWAHSVPGDLLCATLDDIAALTRQTGDVKR